VVARGGDGDVAAEEDLLHCTRWAPKPGEVPVMKKRTVVRIGDLDKGYRVRDVSWMVFQKQKKGA
jgi:hypothetical protein